MKRRSPFILTVALVLLLGGCATNYQSTSQLPVEARNQSLANDQLLRDMLTGLGGVAFVDQALYPDVGTRIVLQVETVSLPDESGRASERWYVQHDGNETVTYLITLEPDGQGGTYFSTTHEQEYR